MHEYLVPVKSLFEQHADPEKAVPMKRYMRDQFEFLGIQTPARRKLFQQFVAEHGLPAITQLEPILRDLWRLPQREYQYVALDLLSRLHKQLEPEFIQVTEDLITTKSWWDTVDGLASHTVGGHFARYRQVRDEYLARWRVAENIWLRRTTLLFQLRYKDKTDRPLLFALIRENLDSDEFFIQKAIGWALREYSKTNAQAVQDFVDETQMAPLSRREALKWLKAHGLAG